MTGIDLTWFPPAGTCKENAHGTENQGVIGSYGRSTTMRSSHEEAVEHQKGVLERVLGAGVDAAWCGIAKHNGNQSVYSLMYQLKSVVDSQDTINTALNGWDGVMCFNRTGRKDIDPASGTS